MNDDKKVSIILCFYNEEKYLREAIDSVLAQTYTNFELVIVNDGSTDGSESIVKSYGDDRIVYVTYEGNKRLAYARNRGLEKATGEYVGFFDGDDILLPDKIEKEVRFLNEHPEILLVSGGYRMMDAKGNIQQDIVFPKYHTNQEIRGFMLFGNCIACAGAALFRKSVIYKYNLSLDETNKASEDYQFWISMLNCGQFANIDECFFNYRVNHGSKASLVVSKDENAYRDEIEKVIQSAWLTRGFKLKQDDLEFIHGKLHDRMRIITPHDIIQGIKTYRKVREQSREMGLCERKFILKYYKMQWLRTYKTYWVINDILEIRG